MPFDSPPTRYGNLHTLDYLINDAEYLGIENKHLAILFCFAVKYKLGIIVLSLIIYYIILNFKH